MLIRNEAGRYLYDVLNHAAQYVSKANAWTLMRGMALLLNMSQSWIPARTWFPGRTKPAGLLSIGPETKHLKAPGDPLDKPL